MREIRITSGLYGHRPREGGYITPVKAGARLTLPDAECERLVSIGVASYVQVHREAKGAYSAEMKADKLRGLMEKAGLSFQVGMTKADMVAALDGRYDGGEEETPPALDLQEPVT